VDANGNPVRIFITAGTTADCTLGEELIKGIDADVLLADRGYDVNAIIERARSMGMEVVIPPKKNRKDQREYDKDLYKLRHLVENAFMILKQWRGIATRYAKNTDSFLAAVCIRSLLHWAKLHA
jgi:transposase